MTEQSPASSPAAAAGNRPSAKAGGAGPGIKGDMRAGVSYWSMGTMVAGIASDLAKPVADLALWLFILFAVAAGVCAWLAFFRNPPMQVARTLLGTTAIGTGIFGFFLLAPMFAGSEGKDRGIIAAVVPPVAAVQTAVLPLTETEKQLLTLGTQISTGDPEARSAHAREALQTTEEPALRRGMLERVLRSPDPNVQQAGLVSAMKDRGRTSIPLVVDRAATSPLAASISGAQVEFYSVNEQTGGVTGIFHSGPGNPRFSGSIANGRLVISTQYFADGKWNNGLVIDVAVDNRLQLVGDARTPAGESIKVELPIL